MLSQQLCTSYCNLLMQAVVSVLSDSLCHGNQIAIEHQTCIAQLQWLSSSPHTLHILYTTTLHYTLITQPASTWHLPVFYLASLSSVLLLQGEWGYVVIAAEVLAKLCHMTGRAAVQCSLLEAALAILTTAEPWLPLLTRGKVVAQVCEV